MGLGVLLRGGGDDELMQNETALAPIDEEARKINLWQLLILARSAQAKARRRTTEASSTIIARELGIDRARVPRGLEGLEVLFGNGLQLPTASQNPATPASKVRRSGVLSKRGRALAGAVIILEFWMDMLKNPDADIDAILKQINTDLEGLKATKERFRKELEPEPNWNF